MRNAIRLVLLNSKKYAFDLISAVIAVAYSLRRLYASYTGAAIRVRRSSDNAQIDIGFIGEHLDVLALLVFVGSGDGFVTIWYDQSGNGRHATQTTAANQPQIVSNGAIITEGGRPLISFDGLTQFLNLPVSGAPTQNSSLIGVFQTTNVSYTLAGFINIEGVVINDPSIRVGVGTGGSQTFYRAYWNGAYVSVDNPAVNFQNLSVFNVSFVTSGGVITTTVRVNGSNAFSASAAGTWAGANEFTIGCFKRINAMKAGIAQELISIQSDLSTVDRQTLERNQGIYYNISVS
jgi:trimeric autotransporter adhesin